MDRAFDRRQFLRRMLSLAAAAGVTGACTSSGAAQVTTGGGTAADPRRDDPVPGGDDGPPARTGRMSYGDDVPADRALPRRVLGRTGVTLPVLGLGGYHLGQETDERTARALVDAALDEGVRFFDTAESYQIGDDSRSERWLGRSLEGMRDEVFLMSKTFAHPERSAAASRAHLEGSLERMRTDHLDLWQLHSIRTEQDVDRSFAPGGSMEAVLAARDEGLVRFVGVTGHALPRAHLRALHHWDEGLRFDTVQMPVNPIDAHQLSFQRDVLPELRARGIGVIAMKTAASGALVERELCTIDECLRYVLALPVDVIVSGMGTTGHLRHNAAALRAGPWDEAELEALLARLAPYADPGLEWYKQA